MGAEFAMGLCAGFAAAVVLVAACVWALTHMG